MTNLVTTEWYEQLREELDAALTEMRHNARWLLIEWNHKIGQTIREHVKEDVDSTLDRLSHDLQCSKKTLYNAVAIFDNFPTLEAIPDGKNASMNKLLKHISAGKPKEECTHLEIETIQICKNCGRKV